MSEIKIHAAVTDLSAKLAGHIHIDAKGVAKIDDGVFLKNLPEDLTAEQIKAVDDYKATYIAAAGHAFGTHALESMKKHKAIDEIKLVVPVAGKDHLDLTFTRSKSFPNPADTANPITSYGVLDGKYTVQEARHKIGQFGNVRKALGAAALAAFGESK